MRRLNRYDGSMATLPGDIELRTSHTREHLQTLSIFCRLICPLDFYVYSRNQSSEMWNIGNQYSQSIYVNWLWVNSAH